MMTIMMTMIVMVMMMMMIIIIIFIVPEGYYVPETWHRVRFHSRSANCKMDYIALVTPAS